MPSRHGDSLVIIKALCDIVQDLTVHDSQTSRCIRRLDTRLDSLAKELKVAGTVTAWGDCGVNKCRGSSCSYHAGR
jgi:hypothetical protein